ncbi:retrotransposon protein, putative, Ty3-gypsy subclass [Panicum miliaceum]|uniref:Retrotransposon protein, putative, Ty3-gypsy subclass n=1 Tax=Panicum miliaceum TaxID=4540 RepID=A0A3L6RUI2_PANMI|nr:retrotransposon protein, putative, Ty3-gypsy subclass [Panicum miliaceum]
MMRRWADQEDEENKSFPKRKNDKGNNNNNHPDKGQYSGAACKRKPEDQVANVKRNPRNKKLGKLRDQYKKILHKQCPMHPKAKHAMFQCTILRKSLNALPPPDDEEKDKDKADEDNDKSGPPGFQHPTNTVYVIFRGEDDTIHYSSEERKVINDLVSNTLYFFMVLVELLFDAFPGANIHAGEVRLHHCQGMR